MGSGDSDKSFANGAVSGFSGVLGTIRKKASKRVNER